MSDFKRPRRILRSEDHVSHFPANFEDSRRDRIDEEEVHAQVDKITRTTHFQYIQSETKKLSESMQNYKPGFAGQ